MPLIGTTVAEFWACQSLVGIGLCTVTYSMYNIVDIGGCSALGAWELYFITGLVSDGDWAPNDQIGRLDG